MNKSYVLLSLFPVLILLAWQNRDDKVVVQADHEQVLSASAEAGIVVPTQDEADLYEISAEMIGGRKKNPELDEEWAHWVGNETPKKWSELNLKKAHRLSMVLSEYQNLADSPFRIMNIHSIGYDGQSDDTTTYYTDEIDGIDEKNFRMNLVVPQIIEANGDRFMLSETQRELYQVKLVEQDLLRVSNPRAPRVKTGDYFHQLRESDLDLVRQLINDGSGLSESGLYEREMDWMGKTYQVQLNLRETELETTTIEVQLRPIDSLNIQRFALVYEAI